MKVFAIGRPPGERPASGVDGRRLDEVADLAVARDPVLLIEPGGPEVRARRRCPGS